MPVPTVGTFVYMDELKSIIYLSYCKVFSTDDVIGGPYDIIEGIPSPTVISFVPIPILAYLFIYLAPILKLFLFSYMYPLFPIGWKTKF